MKRFPILLVTIAVAATACSDEPQAPAGAPDAMRPQFGAGFNQNDYQQCQTGNPRNGNPCNWINGVLNATHNVYFEGDVIPQKLIVEGASTSTVNTLTLTYGFKKSNHGNYDFLARYDAGSGPSNPCSDTQTKMAQFCASGNLISSQVAASFPAPVQGNLTATDAAAAQLAFSRFTGALGKLAEVVIVNGSFAGINAADQVSVATYAIGGGDIEATVTFKFKRASASKEVLFLWGAHLARELDWGTGNGSAGQDGAPFHTKMASYNGTTSGSMSLNVMGDVVVLSPKAKITVGVDGVNAVGSPHTVTGSVFTAADATLPYEPVPDGTTITFAIASGPGALTPTSCTTTGGSCSVQLSSTQFGTTVVNASATVQVGTTPFTLTTDGQGDNSGPLTKQWVDASVAISPETDTNGIGEAHVFDITVTAHPAGATPVAFTSITPSVTPAPSSSSNTCGSPTVNGNVATCTLTINNSTPGTFTADVTAVVTMGGVAVTRATNGVSGPSGSGSATKVFVDGTLRWLKHDTEQALLAGATFQVCRTHDRAGTDIADECQSVTDGSAPDADTDGGEFQLNGLALGTYVITETAAPAGYAIVTGPQTVVLTLEDTSGEAANPFVNARPDASIAISPLSDTNGIFEDHVFTITVTAHPNGAGTPSFGTITPNLSPSADDYADTCATPSGSGDTRTCTVTISNETPGTFTLNASVQVTIGGVVLTRSTSGTSGPSGSGPATKVFVDGSLSWLKHDGAGNLLGGATFDVCRTHDYNSDTDSFDDITDVCVTDITDADGSFQLDDLILGRYVITETAPPAGYAMLTAPQTVELTTASPNGQATNPFVNVQPNASIAISPLTDTNGITEQHVFTITVTAIPNGASPVVFGTITPSLSPTADSYSDTCASPSGTGNTRSCTVTINHNSAATFTLNASVQVTIGGVILNRATNGNAGPGGSGAATKTYVAGTLGWLKHDGNGQLLAGATFQVCRTHDYVSSSGTFVDLVPDACVSVLDNNSPDADATGGEFQLDNQVLGRYVITETAAPSGYAILTTPQTVELTTSAPSNLSGNLPTFVNEPDTDGKIAPTATTCQDFRDGRAADLNELLATIRRGNINSVAPGVLFYYASVITPADGSMTIQVTQENDDGMPDFAIQGDQAFLYDASCTRVGTMTLLAGGEASISVTAPAGTKFIIGIKYDPTPTVGQSSGSLPTTYTFKTVLDGSVVNANTDTVVLRRK